MSGINWDDKAKDIFDKVISNLPQFHRTIAEKLVKESAENLARDRNSSIVQEKDLVAAFFKEVPPAFKEMMRRLFNKLGIEYEE
ncbi:MAG: hypothetical protein KKC11_09380 [Candidatus Omnitrophica bacterium]|nr:hypothetical protein [Candidatus Omnitrophota bacterium]MBU0878660.1 hypothetical protein [Candidatus Omnitrophota bacterium]MBU0896743.1 hypothetical protein [Candidatus Omnitrophota bacterium]MBU1134777.1 hypothetical protein [Candidatus Omnitrophota bacterium]MBU1366890.1 hypothetical protein [Candidatus Omnitrophota bacterium]